MNQSSLTCLTPNLSETDIPPGTVDVRVCMAGESFTMTKANFTFFPVTDANFCFIYGPGLLEEGAPGRETSFIIKVKAGPLYRRVGHIGSKVPYVNSAILFASSVGHGTVNTLISFAVFHLYIDLNGYVS